MIAVLVVAQGQSGQQPRLPTGTRADAVVIEKTRHTMTLYRDGQALRTYAVSLGLGGLEPKTRAGDNRTPEGRYRIDGRNQRSSFHLSLHISYPTADEAAAAAAQGVDPGGGIMIHGLRNGLGWLGSIHHLMDWTGGCIAVTNREIEEIWRVVPDGTPVEIRH